MAFWDNWKIKFIVIIQKLEIFDVNRVIISDCLLSMFVLFYSQTISAGDILRCAKLTSTNMARLKKYKPIYIVSTYEYFAEKQVLPEFSVSSWDWSNQPDTPFFVSWIGSNQSNTIQPIARFRRIARFFVYPPKKAFWFEKKTLHRK